MSAEFSLLGLSSPLLDVLTEVGFSVATPVQKASIPVLLSGRDAVVRADTGTGKTAAYILPILQRIDHQERIPKVLVLCPTRELSAQVAREFRRLGRQHKGLRVLVLVGGEPRRRQTSALVEGAHVIVGTPGRVLDHLTRKDLRLEALTTVVLDEADRMLEMGFQDELSAILEETPAGRQMAFFSATFPHSIEAMSERYQSTPEQIIAEPAAINSEACAQFVIPIESEDKLSSLRWVLAQHPHKRALVFTNFKASAAAIERSLQADGLSASALHGDLEQIDRDRVMAKFRNGSTTVLVATDVAARGIDVPDLDLVINAELPHQPEIYVHRIGRTGRAGKSGVAVSLVLPRDGEKLAAIEATIGHAIEQLVITEAPTSAAFSGSETAGAPHGPMDTLRISGGRKDKVRPADILGALTGEAGGLAGTDVGKIEIHDTFSYVAVSRSTSRLAVKSLSNGRIKGRKFRVTLEK